MTAFIMLINIHHHFFFYSKPQNQNAENIKLANIKR